MLYIIIKTGIDIVKDVRIIKNSNDKLFLKRIYQPSEFELKNKLVSIFALKEAVFKALGIKVAWHEIEVKYSKEGAPNIILSNVIKPKNLESISCSVSHENGFTIGIVVILLS